MRVKIIDPPSGWLYGFPKVYDNYGDVSVTDWLLVNGYPQSQLDKEGKAYWIRMWEEDIEDSNV